MAGNQEHEAALREAYPEAVQAECDGGPGHWATLTNADGELRSVKCTGCERAEMLKRLGAFVLPAAVKPTEANWPFSRRFVRRG